MAKKKVVKSAKSSSNGQAKSPAKVAATTPARALSNEQIGEVAGEVWHMLEGQEGQTVAAVKKSVNAPPDVATAAIGWLAREDKINFVKAGRTMKLTLR